MTCNIIIISLNNLSREFWDFHIKDSNTTIWQWKTGSPPADMVQLLAPSAIVLDDYFTDTDEDVSNGFIPKILNVKMETPFYYVSPKFSSPENIEKYKTIDMSCTSFCDSFLKNIRNQIKISQPRGATA